MSQEAAAKALGLSPDVVKLYESGKRRGDREGKPVTIPLTVALAMRAVAHKLPPWGDPL